MDLYKVIFKGEIESNRDQTQLINDLALFFNISNEKATSLLNGKLYLFQKNISYEQAEIFTQQLSEIGVITHILKENETQSVDQVNGSINREDSDGEALSEPHTQAEIADKRVAVDLTQAALDDKIQQAVSETLQSLLQKNIENTTINSIEELFRLNQESTSESVSKALKEAVLESTQILDDKYNELAMLQLESPIIVQSSKLGLFFGLFFFVLLLVATAGGSYYFMVYKKQLPDCNNINTQLIVKEIINSKIAEFTKDKVKGKKPISLIEIKEDGYDQSMGKYFCSARVMVKTDTSGNFGRLIWYTAEKNDKNEIYTEVQW